MGRSFYLLIRMALWAKKMFMRITPCQRNIIAELATKYFGLSSRVILFGSRADDNETGGDLDLLIYVDHKRSDWYQKKLAFLAELKSAVGDQRIDLVLAEKDSNASFVKQVAGAGVSI